MADNKQYLHYDPDTKKLYIGDDCDTNPVYTLTSFQEGDLFVDENYRLNLRDINGNVYVISESLKGEKGDKGDSGEKGEDGNNGIDTNAIFHLELSNDMDQIYVDADNKVVCDQTIWTDITLYNGSDIISDLNGSGWTLTATLGNTEYVSVVGRRVLLTFPEDATLNWESGSSVCEIKATHKVDGIIDKEVIKDFKIKRLQGTHDYDLVVSPSCIKVNDNGKPTTSEVSVKIKKRALGQISSVEYISPNELPDLYSVTYKWIQSDNQSRSVEESALTTDTITLSDSVDFSKSLQIQLKYDSDIIDLANIEFLKDGKDGEIPKHIELSNDYDQLYVEDGKIKSAAPYIINVQYFEGVNLQQINPTDISISVNDAVYTVTKEQGKDNNTVKVTITPKKENAFTGDPGTTITIPIVYGVGITKNFTLVVLEGNTDYDLYVKPDVIKAYQDSDGNWIYDDSTFDIEVWSKTVGVVNSVPSKYDGIPEGYTVSYTVDGGQEVEITTLSDINVPTVNDNETRPNKISVQLKQENTLVDWVELAILYDGTKGIKGDKGDKGDDGASAYYIDLSNDFDQLYNQQIDGVKTLLPNQSFETEVRLYKGSQLVAIPSTASLVCSKDSGSTNGITCSIAESGVGSVTINFSQANAENEEVTHAEITSTDLEQTSIAYKISLSGTIDGESIDLHKTVRITNITGTEDFDLKCNVTTIAKDSSGNLHDRELPTFSVKRKDLLGNSASVVTYDTLSAISDAGLTLKYTIDGTAPENATDYGDLSGIQVSPDILNRTNEYLKVSLHKDGREIDYVLLDVVQDGKNATLYYTELSNDLDQVYVNADKYVTIESIPVSTIVSLYKGTEQIPITISDVVVSLTGELSNNQYIQLEEEQLNDSVKITITFTEGAHLAQPGYTIPITVQKEGAAVMSKQFMIKVFTGNESYDLNIENSVIYVSPTGVCTPSSLNFSVDKTTYGESAETVSNAPLPQGWSVMHRFDNGQTQTVSQNTSDNTFSITLPPDASNTKVLKIQLNNNSENVDAETIQFVRDGKDGKDGKDGINASGFVMDFSNDADQLYVDDTGTFYTSQSVSTQIKGFSGVSALPVNAEGGFIINSVTVSDSSLENVFSVSCLPDGEDYYTLTITPTYNSSIDNDLRSVSFVIDAIIGHQPVQRYYKIHIFRDTADYDLESLSSTRIRVNNGVAAPASITVNIQKRILSATQPTSPETLEYSSWSGQNLSIKYQYAENSSINDNFWNNASSWTNSYGTNGISTSGYTDTSKCLALALLKDNIIRDYAIIDIVSDGEPGPPGTSGITLQATVDTPTVYLNSNGKALQQDQTVTVSFQASNGGTISGLKVNGTEVEDGLPWSKTFNHDGADTYSLGVQTYTVSATVTLTDESSQDVSTQFSINIVPGITTYDLKASPAYIKYNPNDESFEDIEFTVYSEISGGGYFEETELNWTACDLTLKGGSNGDDPIDTSGASGEIFTWQPESATQTHIKLFDNENDLKDFIILPVVEDGKDGEIKTEIANEFLVYGIGDKEDQVVAGLTKDPVFFWGGGTQEESREQKPPLYFNTDGTGKIGVFEINKNNIEINSDFVNVKFTNSQNESIDAGEIKWSNSTWYNGINNFNKGRTIENFDQSVQTNIQLGTLTGLTHFLMMGQFKIKNVSLAVEAASLPDDSSITINSTVTLDNLHIHLYEDGNSIGKIGGSNNKLIFEGSKESSISTTDLGVSISSMDGTWISEANNNYFGTVYTTNPNATFSLVISYTPSVTVIRNDGGEIPKLTLSVTPDIKVKFVPVPTIIIGTHGLEMHSQGQKFVLTPGMNQLKVILPELPQSPDDLAIGQLYELNGAVMINK